MDPDRHVKSRSSGTSQWGFLTDEHGASIVTSVCPTWVVVVVVCHEDCSIVLLPPVINGLSGVHVLLTPLGGTGDSLLITLDYLACIPTNRLLYAGHVLIVVPLSPSF